MKQNQQSRKKAPAWVPFAVVLFFILLSSIGGEAGFLLVFSILFLLIPVGIIAAVIFAIKKSKAAHHTHDRIDHRADLKINPETGKAENVPIRNTAQHSPQEHWKQQLDGLLANGTIDRSEYRAMLNRKF